MYCSHCKLRNTRLCKTKKNRDIFNAIAEEAPHTTFNFIQCPTEVVMLTVHYYCRFRNILDKLTAMRGFDLCHQAVHNWVQTSEVELVIRLRARHQELAGKKWYIDTTYIRMEERWRYFYRAIDKEGYLADTYLSDFHGEAAAEASFNQSKNTTGIILDQVTTDKGLALIPCNEKCIWQ